jgi:hypothetical protein
MPRFPGPRDPDGSRYKRAHGQRWLNRAVPHGAFGPITKGRQANKGGQCRAYLERDHRSLRSKIALRRWLLQQMGLTDVSVLDACSGEGFIWAEMEKYVTIRRWVRTDIKPRSNGAGQMVLKMSAAQAVASMDLSDFSVIDVDPYGEPWEAYRIILERFTQPTAVFLTHGRVAYDVTDHTRDAMGIPRSWPIPQLPAVVDFIVQRTLEETRRWARIDHAGTFATPPAGGRAPVNYYALAIRPL